MSERTGFVVLHYNTVEDTCNCVNSILRNVPGSPVVVVDNGSPNGTGKALSEEYKDTAIKVICLGENMGFAKGNNVGIHYLREKTDVEFIVVQNNDTEILQDSYERQIVEEYERSKFALLGPKVITKDGTISTNPIEDIIDSKRKAAVLVIKRCVKLFLNTIHLNWFLNDVGTGVIPNTGISHEVRQEGVMLHGCCLIFSPSFFSCFDGLYDRTFLYAEENILYLQLKKANLKTVYLPSLEILHLEDSATNSIVKNNREKNIFVLKNQIRSLVILFMVLSYDTKQNILKRKN